MIRIACTSCKRELQIDDAFAGGVCRCQFCGTIQTVPARAKGQKAAVGAPKALFETKKFTTPTGSGLEDLADIVASSGLSDRNLRRKPPEPEQSSSRTVILAVIAGVVVLGIGIGVIVYLKHPTTATEAPPPVVNDQPASPAAPIPAGPNFCGTAISADTVVYVIDNGSSSEHFLDPLKLAVLKSVDSLGPDRRFQILFWNPETGTYPTGQMTAHAVHDNVEAARKKLDDVMALGSTDPVAAVKIAVADQPGEIVLITGKAADLDPSVVGKIMDLRGGSPIKIHCFAVNGSDSDKVLKQIADKTGGVFVPIAESSLKAFAE